MSVRPEKREYNFSDAKLSTVGIDIAQNVTRDLVDFAGRAVDAATVSNLQAEVLALDNTPTDGEMRSLVTVARQTRDAKKADLLKVIKSVRTMAANTWGVEDGRYKFFDFEDLYSLNDNWLYRRAMRVERGANRYMTELAAEGMDPAWITSIQNKYDDFRSAFIDLDTAEEDRDLMTLQRIKQGNKVYREVLRLTNIGKDIYADNNAAKYNDYIIYNTSSGNAPSQPDTTLTVETRSIADNSILQYTTVTYEFNGQELTILTDENGRHTFTAIDPLATSAILQFFKQNFLLLSLNPNITQGQDNLVVAQLQPDV